ncbi:MULTISPECIES: hypothetical protein [Aphanothece]|uniref:hypothetical protein n=1 Tax=Aphanothece TaxID=1121 RepID=UPI00398E3B41
MVPMQRHVALPLLMLASLGGLAVSAPAVVIAKEPQYPSEELLRRLQLDTIACGRDNRREDCDKSRTTADPMLDNPLLSGSCKDALWTIGQQAVVASRNDFARRDALTDAANDMVRFCRRQTTPVKPGSASPSGDKRRPGGFGLVPGS